MAINFPGSLDNFTNPTSASPINSPSHADQHANANDAIEALEAKVGVDGSSVITSHDYKIAQLQSLVTSAVAGAKSIYQDVRNQSGSAFTKATPVYVSGSTGASGQLLVSAASNATEATSSKTMGITTSAISNNSNGQVISEGILEGIDTTGAADGDPVWLGVNGAKIYGLANKPSAPAHLVFLGIVIRGGQANTGSMYVKIQNGFELHELHNVEISSLVNGNILAYDSTTQTWKNTNTLQSTSSTTPLVIKASASQSVDIFQIQNSSGNPIFYVNQYNQLIGNQPIYQYNTLYLGSPATSAIPLTVRGAASQTANLQEWQNNAGGVVSSISSIGLATFTIVGVTSNIYSYFGKISANTQALGHLGQLSAVTADASTIGLVIRGSASQTANLQEWQDSAGIVKASIRPSGGLSLNYANSIRLYNTANTDYAQLWMDNGSGGSNLYVKTNYRVLMGDVGVDTGASLTVATQSTGQVGQVIRGAASQTANLQEWQRSNGNADLLVTNFGTLISGGGTTIASNPTINAYGAAMKIASGVNSYPMLILQAAASQSANIQEWQNNNGTAVSYINSSGTFVSTAGIYLQVSGGNGYGIQSTAGSASTVPIIAQGAASQTANLQQWQDSSGTVLSKISSDGQFTGLATNTNYVQANTPSSSTYLQFSGTSLVVQNRNAGWINLIVKGFASQTANLQEWQNSAGTIIASVSSGGNIQAGTYNGVVIGLNFPGIVLDTSAADNTQVWLRNLSSSTKSGRFVGIKARPFYADAVSGDDLVTLAGQQYISNAAYESGKIVISNDDSTPSITSSPARITFHTTAIGSTTLTERMRISNTGLVGINMTSTDAYLSVTGSSSKDAIRVYSQYGLAFWGGGINNNLYTNGNMYMTGGSWTGTTKLAVDTGGASNNGIVVRGVSGQTADLQQWQTSTGIAKTYIKNVGGADNELFGWLNTDVLSGTYICPTGSTSSAITINSSTSVTFSASIVAGSASSIGLIVKAVASQTADILQIQDSGGTARAIFERGGALSVQPSAALNGYTGFFKSPSSSVAGLMVRGAASQTADLQQWQNSAGGSVARISAYGDLYIPDSRIALGSSSLLANTFLFVNTSYPSYVPIVARGAASQTADLQQWQNSSGTVLTSVFPSGNISIGTTQAGVHGQANSQGVVTTETAPLIVRGSAPGQNMIELWAYGKDAYITGAVGNGTSVTYTTSIAHGFTTSDYVTVNGIIGNPGSGSLNVGGGATVSAVTTYTFTLPNTTTQTYISGGYARNAQYPGNILQAYRSDGMSLFTIGSSGGFAMADVMSVANVGYQQAGISVQPNLTSSAAIRMYGRSAQTAEILDVRNYIYKSGGSDSIFAIIPDYSVSANTDGYGAWVRMKNAATPTTNPTSAGYLYVGSGALNYMGTSNVPQQIVGADGSVKFTSPAASIVPLIIQHASSPSSNYFEIRNSAGNPVWGINSAGESLTRTTTKYGANIQNDSNNNNTALSLSAPSTSGSGIALYVYSGSTTRDMVKFDNSGVVKLTITSDGSLKGGNSNTISVNTASTVDTVALSSFTSMEYTLSIKQGSKIRSSKVLVHTDGTSVDSTEYGIMEMGGGISGILVTASVSSTNAILQVTITDAATTNATVKLIKTML